MIKISETRELRELRFSRETRIMILIYKGEHARAFFTVGERFGRTADRMKHAVEIQTTLWPA